MKTEITNHRPHRRSDLSVWNALDGEDYLQILEAVRRAIVLASTPPRGRLQHYLGAARTNVLITKAVDLGRAFLLASGRPPWLRVERAVPELREAKECAAAAGSIYKNKQARELSRIATINARRVDFNKRALACFQLAASLETEPGFALENVAVAEYALGRGARAGAIWKQLLHAPGRRRAPSKNVAFPATLQFQSRLPFQSRLQILSRSNLAALALDEGRFDAARELLNISIGGLDGDLSLYLLINRIALAARSADAASLDRAFREIPAVAPSLAMRQFAEGQIQRIFIQFHRALDTKTIDAFCRIACYE